MYLKITNKGNVVPEAFSLVGASTKRGNDEKIGMFGSGNKYSIAFLKRNNYDFRIFSGNDEITFTTVDKKLGEETFEVICINDKETSITTEMGHHWTLWQAIRELYSNAKDEGLVSFEVVEDDQINDTFSKDETNIFIEMKPELRDMYENINDYFAINKEILFENEFGKIYKKSSPNTCIYRKGIRCFDTKEQSIFDYDFNTIPIDENRIIQHSWHLPEHIWKLLYQCENDYVIRSILNKINTGNILERNIDDSFVSTYSDRISKNWETAIENSKIAPRTLAGYIKDEDVARTFVLPTKLYHDLVSKIGDKIKPQSFLATSSGVSYTTTDVTPLQIQMLKDVTNFFEECKFEIPYAIDIVKFIDKDIHGGIKDDTILISKNAFEKGKTWIANIIIEEFIHIKYDAADETRKFQDDVIGEFLTYIKTINSFNL